MANGVMGDGVIGDGVMGNGVMSDGVMSDGVMSGGVMSGGVMSDGVMTDRQANLVDRLDEGGALGGSHRGNRRITSRAERNCGVRIPALRAILRAGLACAAYGI